MYIPFVLNLEIISPLNTNVKGKVEGLGGLAYTDPCLHRPLLTQIPAHTEPCSHRALLTGPQLTPLALWTHLHHECLLCCS